MIHYFIGGILRKIGEGIHSVSPSKYERNRERKTTLNAKSPNHERNEKSIIPGTSIHQKNVINIHRFWVVVVRITL
jgi:hypothetical protein